MVDSKPQLQQIKFIPIVFPHVWAFFKQNHSAMSRIDFDFLRELEIFCFSVDKTDSMCTYPQKQINNYSSKVILHYHQNKNKPFYSLISKLVSNLNYFNLTSILPKPKTIHPRITLFGQYRDLTWRPWYRSGLEFSVDVTDQKMSWIDYIKLKFQFLMTYTRSTLKTISYQRKKNVQLKPNQDLVQSTPDCGLTKSGSDFQFPIDW